MISSKFGYVLILGAVACRGAEQTQGGSAKPNASASAKPSSAVTLSAPPIASTAGDGRTPLIEHEPSRRLQLAEALARRAVEADRASLVQLLSDADPTVVAWAALGLGRICSDHESETTRELITRAASLSLLDATPPPPAPIVPIVEPEMAFSLALSRCANSNAEPILLGWLGMAEPRASAAAIGLARLAEQRGHLQDDSLVALLNVADRAERPLRVGLLAVDRLQNLGTAVTARLTHLGEAMLGNPGPDRQLGILALARGDDGATALLAKAVTDTTLSVAERTLAVRMLARRGDDGQAALRELLGKLTPAIGQEAAPWPVALSILRALSLPAPGMHPLFDQLTALKVSDDLPAGEKHRVIQARCLAASLLADTKSDGPRLLGCDPEPSGISGQLALLEVLDRGKLDHGKVDRTREAQWRNLVTAGSPRLRSAALKLIASHSEIDGVSALLSQALQDTEPGPVATAAELLASHPDLAEKTAASDRSPELDADLIAALTHALERQYPPDQIAVRSALLEATGSLKLLNLKSKIEQSCRDPNPTLRRKAKHALELLGDTITNCELPAPPLAVETPETPASKPITLVVETSAGEHRIFLRPDLAPISVKRVVDLVGAGFYDKMPIHRAVPGYVVQFGDPVGDGYGGSGRPPIPTEPSPVHFGAFSVGMADAGRDTASSQIFITLAPAPALDGEYTFIGSASESWANAVLDDVIERVRVE